MAAEEPPALRTPRNVDEAREILARAFKVPPDKVAEHFGLDEPAFESSLRGAINRSLDERGPFLFHWAKVLARREQDEQVNSLQRAFANLRNLQERARSPTTTEAMPVADRTDNLTALGREVSGLDAKVNILLGLAGTLLVGVIAGAIALWQAIGGVETRLARELGQVETRITQQIADVRSEVGEIRGRLSVLVQAPVPPR